MKVQREMRRIDSDSLREESRELVEPRAGDAKVATPKHAVMEDEQVRAAVGSGANHRSRKIDGCRYVRDRSRVRDRKSTRLNSSHGYISYAGFCLKQTKHR